MCDKLHYVWVGGGDTHRTIGGHRQNHQLRLYQEPKRIAWDKRQVVFVFSNLRGGGVHMDSLLQFDGSQRILVPSSLT
jgi:hypothetical protein